MMNLCFEDIIVFVLNFQLGTRNFDFISSRHKRSMKIELPSRLVAS